VKADKADMQRQDTWAQVGGLFTNLGKAFKSFGFGFYKLLPRLGTRVQTIAAYLLLAIVLLYAFIVQGFAEAFVVFVRRSAATLLFPSAIGDVAEF